MTRQQTRAAYRRHLKDARLRIKKVDRQKALRALFDRQSRREKSGFYDGVVSVAMALTAKRAGRLHRRVLVDDGGKSRSYNLTVLI